jgi:hypothetical protein
MNQLSYFSFYPQALVENENLKEHTFLFLLYLDMFSPDNNLYLLFTQSSFNSLLIPNIELTNI